MHTHTPNNHHSLSDNRGREFKFKLRAILNALRMKKKINFEPQKIHFLYVFFADFCFFSFFFAIFAQQKTPKIVQIPVNDPMMYIATF